MSNARPIRPTGSDAIAQRHILRSAQRIIFLQRARFMALALLKLSNMLRFSVKIDPDPPFGTALFSPYTPENSKRRSIRAPQKTLDPKKGPPTRRWHALKVPPRPSASQLLAQQRNSCAVALLCSPYGDKVRSACSGTPPFVSSIPNCVPRSGRALLC